MRIRTLAGGAALALVAAGLAGSTLGSATAAGAHPTNRGATALGSDGGDSGALPDPGFGPSQRAQAIAAFQRSTPTLIAQMNLAPKTALQVKDVIKDADGTTHVRYTRTYAGLPVIGGDFVVHGASSAAPTDVTWDKAGNFSSVDVSSGLSSADAMSAAHVNGTSKLVVWGISGTPRTAYQITSPAPHGMHQITIVDAHSGAQIASYSAEETSNDNGTGKTLYSGNVQIQDDKNGSTYTLRDLTRGGHYVTTMNNTTTSESAPLTQTTNVWGNNSASNANTVAADAQYGAAETWDFYQSLGRNGIRNDGVGARSRVHYDTGYDNAFWSDQCFCMSYGDGSGPPNGFAPLVPLDVAGHEMTHGVTSNTAGLLYLGESGGLNEATSDIMGTSVEFFANNPSDPGDYYIGEKIASNFPGGALRRMDQPSLDGASYDCYAPGIGNADVHYSSGVANHFFYLASEGSGSKTIGGRPHSSSVCAGPAVTGIGHTIVAQIWYRALTVYMVPGTDYKGARDATIRAARDFYHQGTNCLRILQAWNAVSVPVGSYNCAGLLNVPTSGNVILNSGFEAKVNGQSWTQSRSGLIGEFDLLPAPIAHSGVKNAYLGGLGSASTDSISQSVTVPSTGVARLSYYLLVDTSDSDAVKFDNFSVQVTSGSTTTTLQTSDNTQADDSWHLMQVNLKRYAGQTVTLKFTETEDSSLQTGFLVDDVQLRGYTS